MIRGELHHFPSDTMIAAPEGTPLRWIGEQNSKQLPAPLCLAEALSPESFVWRRFHGPGVNPVHVCFSRVILSFPYPARVCQAGINFYVS